MSEMSFAKFADLAKDLREERQNWQQWQSNFQLAVYRYQPKAEYAEHAAKAANAARNTVHFCSNWFCSKKCEGALLQRLLQKTNF